MIWQRCTWLRVARNEEWSIEIWKGWEIYVYKKIHQSVQSKLEHLLKKSVPANQRQFVLSPHHDSSTNNSDQLQLAHHKTQDSIRSAVNGETKRVWKIAIALQRTLTTCRKDSSSGRRPYRRTLTRHCTALASSDCTCTSLARRTSRSFTTCWPLITSHTLSPSVYDHTRLLLSSRWLRFIFFTASLLVYVRQPRRSLSSMAGEEMDQWREHCGARFLADD